MRINSVGVIGGGAFGAALAVATQRAGRDVVLWARSAETVATINAAHESPAYLPGIPLDPSIRATTDMAEAARADVVLMCVPAQAFRATAERLAPLLSAGKPVVNTAKGLEQATSMRLSEIAREVLPTATMALLSGPGFAADLARGLPAALTIACADQEAGRVLAEGLGHSRLRLYWTSDATGVEIGGAVKNVLAIAAGIVVGKRLGASAHAGLVTRAFAELCRLGVALGARSETLTGLSGLGDLLLTCSSPQSRNMSLGIALGEGRALAEVLAGRRTVTEGVATTGAVVRLARKIGVEMPIAEAVHAIIEGRITVDAAIDGLLSRPFRAEG